MAGSSLDHTRTLGTHSTQTMDVSFLGEERKKGQEGKKEKVLSSFKLCGFFGGKELGFLKPGHALVEQWS